MNRMDQFFSDLMSLIDNPPTAKPDDDPCATRECTCDDCLDSKVGRYLREAYQQITQAIEIMRSRTVHPNKFEGIRPPQSPLDKVLADTSMDARASKEDYLTLPPNFRLLGTGDLIVKGDLRHASGRWVQIPDAYIGEDPSKYSFMVRRPV